MFTTLQPALAITSSTVVTTTAAIEKQKTDLKKEFKREKRFARFLDLAKKAGVDFKDSTQKWMWFWIFSWAAGLVLYIVAVAVVVGSATTGSVGGLGAIGILGLLAWLLWLFGLVSLVIWLVKKFAS